MQYVGLSFTMVQGGIYVIQGTPSIFTYANQGNQVMTVLGSNDCNTWNEIVQVAINGSAIKTHSYTYLRCVGNGQLSVNRGMGNSEIGSGNTGNSEFSVKELDLLATADKVQSVIKITPDYADKNIIVGNNIVGEVKSTAPEVLYDTYTLNENSKMYVGGDATFRPEQVAGNHYFTGVIAEKLMEGKQYNFQKIGLWTAQLIFKSQDNQKITTLSFNQNTSVSVEVLDYDSELNQYYDYGQTHPYSDSVIFEIQNNQLVLIAIGRSEVTTDLPKIWPLPENYYYLEIECTAFDSSDDTIIISDIEYYAQLSNCENFFADKLLSAYCAVGVGKIKIDKPLEHLFALVDQEPTTILKYDYENTDSVPDTVIAVMQTGQEEYRLMSGNLFLGDPTIAIIYELPENMLIEFKENSIDFYINDKFVSSYTGEQSYFSKFLQTFNLPNFTYSPLNLKYDLSEIFGGLAYKLPDDSKDGDIYHLISNGKLFNKDLKVNDYITVYDNKQNVVITRLPEPQVLQKSTKIQLDVFKRINDQWSSSKLTSGYLAYYDTELKAAFLQVEEYVNTHTYSDSNTHLFKVDLSAVKDLIGISNGMSIIVFRGYEMATRSTYATYNSDDSSIAITLRSEGVNMDFGANVLIPFQCIQRF